MLGFTTRVFILSNHTKLYVLISKFMLLVESCITYRLLRICFYINHSKQIRLTGNYATQDRNQLLGIHYFELSIFTMVNMYYLLLSHEDRIIAKLNYVSIMKDCQLKIIFK